MNEVVQSVNYKYQEFNCQYKFCQWNGYVPFPWWTGGNKEMSDQMYQSCDKYHNI